ncbi:MAG: hypothetical protein V1874_14335 [Spirochaetota bacterium]
MKRISIICLLIFDAFFSACFDSGTQKADSPSANGTLTMNVSGLSSGVSVGFKVFPGGTSIKQIYQNTVAPEAGGYFTVDINGTGSSVAVDTNASPVTLSSGLHVLRCSIDMDNNQSPSNGDIRIPQRDITINGNTTVNLTVSDFSITLYILHTSIIGSWGVTYIEGAPSSVDFTNSTWNFINNGTYNWFLDLDPYDLSGNGTYAIYGNCLCVTGIVADTVFENISGGCVEIIPSSDLNTFSFLDDEGDEWIYERL